MRKISFQKILPLTLSALSAIISLLTTFLIARPLGPELYGKVQFYIGVIQTTAIVCGLGSNFFLTKNIQFQKNKKVFFTKIMFLIILISILIFPLFYKISHTLLTTFEGNEVAIITCYVCAVSTSVLSCVGGYFLGTFRPAQSSLFESFIPKTGLFILSILLIYIFGLASAFADLYMFIYLGLYGGSAIVFLCILIRKTKLSFTKTEIISLVSFFALTITYSLNTSLSKIIGTEYYGSLAGVGAYSLCVQIIAVSRLFSGVIINLSKPYFSKLQNNPKELIEYFRKITRISAYIVIPFCFGFLAQSKQILGLFGNEYAAFYPLLIVLSVDTLISELTGPNGNLLAMAGHEKIELINGVINILSFLAAALIYKNLGIIGLPLAMLTSTICTNIAKFLEIQIIYKISPYSLGLLIHYIIMAAISYFVFFLISFIDNIYIIIAIDILCGIVLILGFNIINPHKDDKKFFFKK